MSGRGRRGAGSGDAEPPLQVLFHFIITEETYYIILLLLSREIILIILFWEIIIIILLFYYSIPCVNKRVTGQTIQSLWRISSSTSGLNTSSNGRLLESKAKNNSIMEAETLSHRFRLRAAGPVTIYYYYYYYYDLFIITIIISFLIYLSLLLIYYDYHHYLFLLFLLFIIIAT